MYICKNVVQKTSWYEMPMELLLLTPLQCYWCAHVQVYKRSGHMESWLYTGRDAVRQAVVSRLVNTESTGACRVCRRTTDTTRLLRALTHKPPWHTSQHWGWHLSGCVALVSRWPDIVSHQCEPTAIKRIGWKENICSLLFCLLFYVGCRATLMAYQMLAVGNNSRMSRHSWSSVFARVSRP